MWTRLDVCLQYIIFILLVIFKTVMKNSSFAIVHNLLQQFLIKYNYVITDKKYLIHTNLHLILIFYLILTKYFILCL